MEVLYALITLWFFVTIWLKSIDLKKYLMILNPLVILITIPATIFFLFIWLCKYLYLKLKVYWRNNNQRNVNQRNPRVIQDPNQSYELNSVQNFDVNIDQGEEQNVDQVRNQQFFWSICQDNFLEDQRPLAALPCGHIFHFECIDHWIGGQQRNTCPADRRRTSRNQIMRLMI